MSENKMKVAVIRPTNKSTNGGSKPETKGYQPKVSNLNPSKPPQGGSGISQKTK